MVLLQPNQLQKPQPIRRKFSLNDIIEMIVLIDQELDILKTFQNSLHEENAIYIEGWINDQSDKDLLNLLPLLKSLSLAIDVRYILGLKNGEKFIE